MRTASRIAVITAALGAFTLPAGTALAAPPANSADSFGQHVATCAQTMGGFTSTDNPGMHQGAAGWDGQPCH